MRHSILGTIKYHIIPIIVSLGLTVVVLSFVRNNITSRKVKKIEKRELDEFLYSKNHEITNYFVLKKKNHRNYRLKF